MSAKITVYEGTPGDARYRRLYTVVGYILGRMQASDIEILDDIVRKVHDHKGTLEVCCASASAAFRYGQIFIDAWSHIGDEPLLDFHLPDGIVVSIAKYAGLGARG